MRAIASGLIRLYQLLTPSPLRGGCRHHPTCSQYAREAIERYGVWKGGRLALTRLSRCHPFGRAGYDPVP